MTVPPRLFHGLLDDAAIFPPGNVPLPDAVQAYRKRASLPQLGAFICALPRWGELRENLTTGPPLPVSLTVPGGAEDVPAAMTQAAAEPRVDLVALEVPASARRLPDPLHAVTYVELPWAEVTAATAAALVAAGLRLKIRTGGVVASAFPDEHRLARVLSAAVQGGVPFKLTAGLHDPIRHRDSATGFEHHGYLNVLLATARALDGGDVTAALADQDGTRVASAVADLDDSLADRIRQHFVSFGTCSITQPVDGLLRHGLLPEDPR